MTAPRQEFQKKVREKLREITEDAEKEPSLTETFDMRDVGENVEVKLSFKWWPHPQLRNPDDCHKAILELLFQRGQTRYRDIIDLLGTDEYGPFSETKIRERLKKLRELKIISRNKKTPLGYDLDPSFRFEAMRHANSA